VRHDGIIASVQPIVQLAKRNALGTCGSLLTIANDFCGITIVDCVSLLEVIRQAPQCAHGGVPSAAVGAGPARSLQVLRDRGSSKIDVAVLCIVWAEVHAAIGLFLFAPPWG
jgi:hypothetical protein